MDARNSITPQGEKLTNMQPGNQWKKIDWMKVKNHVWSAPPQTGQLVKQLKSLGCSH